MIYIPQYARKSESTTNLSTEFHKVKEKGSQELPEETQYNQQFEIPPKFVRYWDQAIVSQKIVEGYNFNISLTVEYLNPKLGLLGHAGTLHPTSRDCSSYTKAHIVRVAEHNEDERDCSFFRY